MFKHKIGSVINLHIINAGVFAYIRKHLLIFRFRESHPPRIVQQWIRFWKQISYNLFRSSFCQIDCKLLNIKWGYCPLLHQRSYPHAHKIVVIACFIAQRRPRAIQSASASCWRQRVWRRRRQVRAPRAVTVTAAPRHSGRACDGGHCAPPLRFSLPMHCAHYTPHSASAYCSRIRLYQSILPEYNFGWLFLTNLQNCLPKTPRLGLQFIYSEKATKVCKISTVDLTIAT